MERIITVSPVRWVFAVLILFVMVWVSGRKLMGAAQVAPKTVISRQ